MILVRDVFQLKMGKAKEAIALWKEAVPMFEQLGVKKESMRVLTDLVGNYYTLVFEMTHDSPAAWDQSGKHMATPQWQAWHAKMLPLTERGHREIFNVVQ